MRISLDIPAIDIHSHFDHGSPFDCPDGYAGITRELHRRDLGYIKEQYDRLGVVCAAFSTFAAVMEHTECIVEENGYLSRIVSENGWMRQWAVVDPRRPETYSQAAELLSSPRCLGIKIHPSYHGYDIEDYADALFSFAAEHGTVLLMHPAKIEKMPEYADKYPEMKLIIAHLGSVAHVDAIDKAVNGNIYTDTSGSASSLNNVIEYAVSRVGAEKILFGTDGYSCAFQYGRVALSGLADEDKKKILYENALRLFPAAFDNAL